MNTRLTTLLGATGLAAVIVSSSTPYAQLQINPFSQYYENVARAAKQNSTDSTERVRSLLANGVPPDQTDDTQRTAMHYAAINGNQMMILILAKAGAKLDPKEKLGNTPLHLAADANQVEAAKLLLDIGAAVDPENRNGMTPLMVAANRGSVEIVQALLAKGASVTKTDYTGRDAAGWAAESRRPAVVQAIKRAQTAKKS